MAYMLPSRCHGRRSLACWVKVDIVTRSRGRPFAVQSEREVGCFPLLVVVVAGQNIALRTSPGPCFGLLWK